MSANSREIGSIRRVVTGQTADGKSVFTHIEEVEPWQSGHIANHGVWGWDVLPKLPFNSPEPFVPTSVFPGANPGATRVNVVVFPPGQGVEKREPMETSAEYQQLLAAVPAGGSMDPATRMHSTDSIDIAFVLDGEIGLEQEDGTEVTLRRGDTLVQNGARHAWRNRSGAPCTVAFVLVGAKRSDNPSGK